MSPPGTSIVEKPFWFDIEAPANGEANYGGQDWHPIEKGQTIRVRYGQSVRFGNFTLAFLSVSKEDRPVLTLTAS